MHLHCQQPPRTHIQPAQGWVVHAIHLRRGSPKGECLVNTPHLILPGTHSETQYPIRDANPPEGAVSGGQGASSPAGVLCLQVCHLDGALLLGGGNPQLSGESWVSGRVREADIYTEIVHYLESSYQLLSSKTLFAVLFLYQRHDYRVNVI
jgi:hypothetical protein